MITIPVLLNRSIIRDDQSYPFLNKMTDDELNIMYKEIRQVVNNSTSSLATAYVDDHILLLHHMYNLAVSLYQTNNE